MSGDSCMFSPLVRGKKGGEEASKLYKEIHTHIKDRSVTNFLYAFSQLDKIKSKFSSSDFNSQGELKFDVFRKRYHLDELMDQQDEINRANRELGATLRGKPVYYETPEELVGRVLRFNESHSTIRAKIEYSSQGYYINVGVISSQNYNVNRLLQISQNLIGMIQGKLRAAGLNADLSENNKTLFNIMNAFYMMDKFQEFSENTSNVGKAWSKLLLDIFKENAFAKRIIKSFLDDGIEEDEALEMAARAISEYSSTYEGGSKMELTAGQERLINAFLSTVEDKFSDLFDEDAINEMQEKAREGVKNETFEEADSLDIRRVLGELNREYHIDLDTVDALTMNVNKVSELAQKFLQIKIKRMQILENKLGSAANTFKKRRRYQRLQKQINNGEYYTSVLKLLEELVNELAEINKNAAKEQRRVGDYTGDKLKINRISKLVLEQLDAVKAFKKTLEKIKNLEGLEDDSFDADDEIAESIKEVANQALETLIEMEDNARKKQYDCVQSFLRIYWGEDTKEAQKERGSSMTLEDIMKAGVADIGFFDRMLYAATQTEDVMMNLIAEAVRREKNVRNSVMLEYKNEIQSLTSKLYKSGSDSTFMFVKDSNGYPVKIVSPFDYQRYESDLQKYMEKIKKDPTIKKADWDRLRQEWEHDHSEDYEYSFEEAGETIILKLRVPKRSLYANRNFQVGWTDQQKEYYEYMMNTKASLIEQIGTIDPNTLYDVVEISSDMIDAMHQAKGDPMKIYNAFKNKFVDMFKAREDDDEYGKLYEANGIQVTHVDVDGTPLNKLPIFYTHKMKDRSRVSMDFSRTMVAYLSASLQYLYMNNIIDALMLSKDYMMNRNVAQHSGNGMMADIYKVGKTMYVNTAQKAGVDTSLGGLADDFFEREVFGKRKKSEMFWGMNLGKLSDFLTGYSSVTGLALNTMGATANVLVGKIQMLIESGLGMGGEFFNLKELAHADVKYWALLPAYLGEISSIQKSSLMSMLIDRFDALDNFYEKLREQGFYKGPLEKIVGNKELFFLYGSGEHLLHTQGMIAVLLHTKCKHNGHEVPLFEAFDVEKDENGQGRLIVKEGYTLNDGTEITDEYLDLIKDRIKFVNTTMHGAFNSEDRGMIHRYALGRLVMNFRQWMPAHYARRFKGRYYDPLLRQFREGYYVTSFHFLTNLVKDLRRGTLDWGRLWHELDEGQQYNLKRAAAETFLLIAVNAMLFAIGPAKDHKHNWALRHTIYQLLRVNMEIQASTPVAAYGFIKNILKILNSPTAVLNVVGKWSDLLRFTDIARTIESGKHAGENLYFRNTEKAVPFVQHVDNLINIDDHEELFNYVAR